MFDEGGQLRQPGGERGGFGRGFGDGGAEHGAAVGEAEAGGGFAQGGLRLAAGGGFEQRLARGGGQGVGLFEGEGEGQVGEPLAVEDGADAAVGGAGVLRGESEEGFALHALAPGAGGELRGAVEGGVRLHGGQAQERVEKCGGKQTHGLL